MTLLWLQFYDF